MAEGRDNQHQGGTAATLAQGARRSLWGWLPSIQQHGQQQHELAARERLFIGDEISAKANVTVPTQTPWHMQASLFWELSSSCSRCFCGSGFCLGQRVPELCL